MLSSYARMTYNQVAICTTAAACALQKKLEDITYKLRIPQRKPWPEMAKDITAATNVVQNRDKVSWHRMCLHARGLKCCRADNDKRWERLDCTFECLHRLVHACQLVARMPVPDEGGARCIEESHVVYSGVGDERFSKHNVLHHRAQSEHVLHGGQVMYGVPQGEQERAQQLADDILNGLRSTQTAIEGRCAQSLVMLLLAATCSHHILSRCEFGHVLLSRVNIGQVQVVSLLLCHSIALCSVNGLCKCLAPSVAVTRS